VDAPAHPDETLMREELSGEGAAVAPAIAIVCEVLRVLDERRTDL
jgi:hypothetical protein